VFLRFVVFGVGIIRFLAGFVVCSRISLCCGWVFRKFRLWGDFGSVLLILGFVCSVWIGVVCGILGF